MGQLCPSRRQSSASSAAAVALSPIGPSGASGNGTSSFSPQLPPMRQIHSELVNEIFCLSRDLILSACEDKSAFLTDWKSGECQQKYLGHKGAVNRVTVAPDSSLFTASRDTTVCRWKRDGAEPIQTYAGHDLTVKGLVCSLDGATMCSGSRDAAVVTWDVERGMVKSKKTIAQNLVTHMRWIPRDESCFLQSSEDLRLRIWDTRDLSVAQVFEGHTNIQMWCDVSSDGMNFLSCSNGFDSAGCEVKTRPIFRTACGVDGNWLQLWDRRIGRQMCEMRGHSQSVTSVAFLPSPTPVCGNAAFCATSSADSTLRVWELNTGTEVSSRQTPTDDRIYCLSAFPTVTAGSEVDFFGFKHAP